MTGLLGVVYPSDTTVWILIKLRFSRHQQKSKLLEPSSIHTFVSNGFIPKSTFFHLPDVITFWTKNEFSVNAFVCYGPPSYMYTQAKIRTFFIYVFISCHIESSTELAIQTKNIQLFCQKKKIHDIMYRWKDTGICFMKKKKLYFWGNGVRLKYFSGLLNLTKWSK